MTLYPTLGTIHVFGNYAQLWEMYPTLGTVPNFAQHRVSVLLPCRAVSSAASRLLRVGAFFQKWIRWCHLRFVGVVSLRLEAQVVVLVILAGIMLRAMRRQGS